MRLLKTLGVDVRSGNLGTPGSVLDPVADLSLWERRGVSPTLQRLTLDLHGGATTLPNARICIETEFVFEQTGNAIGPQRMRLIHRAAGGGLVKLTRYLCSINDPLRYGRVDSRSGADLDLLPIDFSALGNSECHARTTQFLLLFHASHDRASTDLTKFFAEIFQP